MSSRMYLDKRRNQWRDRQEFNRYERLANGPRRGVITFDVDTKGLERALALYATKRQKSDADVVNKAMRYVLPAAARRVKVKTPGPSSIRKELIGRPGRVSRGKKKRDQLANTLASAIIAARLRKKGPQVFPTPKDADDTDLKRIGEFYDRVRTFVNARIRSANFLSAGFIPAFRQFNVPNKSPRGQIHFKGRSIGIKAKPALRGIAEAYARNSREAAYKIAPRAFIEAVRDVRKLFLKWVSDDMGRDAKRSGFY